MLAAWRPLACAKKISSRFGVRYVLRLPDLDHAKSAVLNTLSSLSSRRNYKFAMDQLITWYCSEPRLALNRTVVLRFRLYLESLGLAAGTVNQRLAAVRRLAYEAADSGLLSPELAAGIRRVKGVKQLGSRAGNWLTRDQAHLLLEKADGESLRSTRDVAMISILLGCGLRRAELASLSKQDVQIRQGHWVIVDLVGTGGHVRTVPMPTWVKRVVDKWMTAAAVTDGRIFRAVSRHGTADPVSSRARLSSDDRAIPRLQAESRGPRERSVWVPVFSTARIALRPVRVR